MQYEYNGDLDASRDMGDVEEIEYSGWLARPRSGEGFMVEIVPANFEAGQDRVVYKQPFDVPAE